MRWQRKEATKTGSRKNQTDAKYAWACPKMRQDLQRQQGQVEPQTMAPTANTTCSRWLSQVNTPIT